MEKYNHKKVEKKWQEGWKKQELHKADDMSGKEKKYILDMFPYPSGAGLHVGHVESYTATDIYARYLRMRGFNVLHPQGWDAFGLPAENYAIKTNVHPSKTTKKAMSTFKRQINSLGFSYDWSREINTSDPDYYKWTQWFFLFLYKNGLAYKKKAKVNWCESCQTVLANEQAEGGKCERCENPVIQKDLEQWFFKITDFIEDQEHEGRKIKGLLSGLDNLDWPESTKSAQRNWIGRSEGAMVKFRVIARSGATKQSRDSSDNDGIASSLSSAKAESAPRNDSEIEVFTTRPDTLFGATYFVISPEHPIIENYKSQIINYKEVENYIKKAKSKTELERTDLAKEKTGVELKGVNAVNPVNGEEIPVFIADYVMMGYGTGAIMAVPAHDERDFEFARKYDLPIKEVVAPYLKDNPKEDKETEKRDVVTAIVKNSQDNTYLCLDWKTTEWKSFPTGGIDGDDLVEAARREVREETGYRNLKFIKQVGDSIFAEFYRPHKDSNVFAHFKYLLFELENEEKDNVSQKEKDQHEAVWVRETDIEFFINVWNQKIVWQRLTQENFAYCGDGININSDFLDGLKTKDAKEKMIAWLEEKGLGKQAVNYKLRDWLVSRQRYWGAPIPIIYCDICGEVPVAEKDLPVELPDDVDFKPTGESPLKYSKKFQKVKCPKCGKAARRESDTMDTFVCSSWYYLRYADPKNKKEFAGQEQLKKWLPVDLYVGGAEHTVLHLLYSRFFTKALQKYGYIDFNEPFLKLRHQGIILAEDGQKMSKSKGNVVNPDEVIKEYGADILRMYEMFMGPLEDMKPWNTKGIMGMQRFLFDEKDSKDIPRYLQRVYGLLLKIKEDVDKGTLKINNNFSRTIHKTIKKITSDIEDFKFNTAIAELMIFFNGKNSKPDWRPKLNGKGKWEKVGDIGIAADIESTNKFILLLAPFAPHLTEELWNKLGHKTSIFKEEWPKYDEKLVRDEMIQLVLQINGKLRDTIEVAADISEDEAKKLALGSSKIKKWIEGEEVVKMIFVKGKLVNIVIK